MSHTTYHSLVRRFHLLKLWLRLFEMTRIALENGNYDLHRVVRRDSLEAKVQTRILLDDDALRPNTL